jgi:hypothetical protein
VAAFEQLSDHPSAKKSGGAGYQDNQILLSVGRSSQPLPGYMSQQQRWQISLGRVKGFGIEESGTPVFNTHGGPRLAAYLPICHPSSFRGRTKGLPWSCLADSSSASGAPQNDRFGERSVSGQRDPPVFTSPLRILDMPP